MTTPTTPNKSAPEKGMARYTKKPVTIDAWQLTEAVALNYWENKVLPPFGCKSISGEYNKHTRIVREAYFYIDTLEGLMKASLGDWIIKGVKGEIYPCKPDIFEATYNPAQETGQQDAERAEALLVFKMILAFGTKKSLECLGEGRSIDFKMGNVWLSKQEEETIISALSAEKNYVGEDNAPHKFLVDELEDIVMRDDMPPTGSGKPDCKKCGGKGWRMMDMDTADPCPCVHAPSSPREGVEGLIEDIQSKATSENWRDWGNADNGIRYAVEYLHAQGHLASQTSAPDAGARKGQNNA